MPITADDPRIIAAVKAKMAPPPGAISQDDPRIEEAVRGRLYRRNTEEADEKDRFGSYYDLRKHLPTDRDLKSLTPYDIYTAGRASRGEDPSTAMAEEDVEPRRAPSGSGYTRASERPYEGDNPMVAARLGSIKGRAAQRREELEYDASRAQWQDFQAREEGRNQAQLSELTQRADDLGEQYGGPGGTRPSDVTQRVHAATKASLEQQRSAQAQWGPIGDMESRDLPPMEGNEFADLLRTEAERQDIPPELAYHLMMNESSGDPDEVSPEGATGLMQLMPDAATDMGVTDRNDPVQSIRGGLGYLRKMLDQFDQNWMHALAAYNHGPGNVGKLLSSGEPFFDNLPVETQNYLKHLLPVVANQGAFARRPEGPVQFPDPRAVPGLAEQAKKQKKGLDTGVGVYPGPQRDVEEESRKEWWRALRRVDPESIGTGLEELGGAVVEYSRAAIQYVTGGVPTGVSPIEVAQQRMLAKSIGSPYNVESMDKIREWREENDWYKEWAHVQFTPMGGQKMETTFAQRAPALIAGFPEFIDHVVAPMVEVIQKEVRDPGLDSPAKAAAAMAQSMDRWYVEPVMGLFPAVYALATNPVETLLTDPGGAVFGILAPFMILKGSFGKSGHGVRALTGRAARTRIMAGLKPQRWVGKGDKRRLVTPKEAHLYPWEKSTWGKWVKNPYEKTLAAIAAEYRRRGEPLPSYLKKELAAVAEAHADAMSSAIEMGAIDIAALADQPLFRATLGALVRTMTEDSLAVLYDRLAADGVETSIMDEIGATHAPGRARTLPDLMQARANELLMKDFYDALADAVLESRGERARIKDTGAEAKARVGPQGEGEIGAAHEARVRGVERMEERDLVQKTPETGGKSPLPEQGLSDRRVRERAAQAAEREMLPGSDQLQWLQGRGRAAETAAMERPLPSAAGETRRMRREKGWGVEVRDADGNVVRQHRFKRRDQAQRYLDTLQWEQRTGEVSRGQGAKEAAFGIETATGRQARVMEIRETHLREDLRRRHTEARAKSEKAAEDLKQAEEAARVAEEGTAAEVEEAAAAAERADAEAAIREADAAAVVDVPPEPPEPPAPKVTPTPPRKAAKAPKVKEPVSITEADVAAAEEAAVRLSDEVITATERVASLARVGKAVKDGGVPAPVDLLSIGRSLRYAARGQKRRSIAQAAWAKKMKEALRTAGVSPEWLSKWDAKAAWKGSERPRAGSASPLTAGQSAAFAIEGANGWYELSVKRRARSPGARRAARRGVEDFVQHLEEEGISHPGNVTYADMARWATSLEESAGNMARKIYRQAYQYMEWYRDARMGGQGPTGPKVRLVPEKESAPKSVPRPETWEPALAAIPTGTPMGLMERALLELGSTVGVSAIDVPGLTPASFDLPSKIMRLIRSKTGVSGAAPGWWRPAAWAWLAKWFEAREKLLRDPAIAKQVEVLWPDPALVPAFFRIVDGKVKRFNKEALQTLVRKYMTKDMLKDTGGSEPTWHMLRGYVATTLTEFGVPAAVGRKTTIHRTTTAYDSYARHNRPGPGRINVGGQPEALIELRTEKGWENYPEGGQPPPLPKPPGEPPKGGASPPPGGTPPPDIDVRGRANAADAAVEEAAHQALSLEMQRLVDEIATARGRGDTAAITEGARRLKKSQAKLDVLKEANRKHMQALRVYRDALAEEAVIHKERWAAERSDMKAEVAERETLRQRQATTQTRLEELREVESAIVETEMTERPDVGESATDLRAAASPNGPLPADLLRERFGTPETLAPREKTRTGKPRSEKNWRAAKPVSVNKSIQALESMMNATEGLARAIFPWRFRIGRHPMLRKGRGGQSGRYDPVTGLSRLREFGALKDASHELAHAIRTELGISYSVLEKHIGELRKFSYKKLTAEMIRAATPEARRALNTFLDEGWAEFVRLYNYDLPMAEKYGPQLRRMFHRAARGLDTDMTVKLKDAKAIGKNREDVLSQMAAIRHSIAITKMIAEDPTAIHLLPAAEILVDTENTGGMFTMNKTQRGHRLIYALFDDLHALRVARDAANQILDLRGGRLSIQEDFYKVGRLHRGVLGKVEHFLMRSPFKFRTGRPYGTSYAAIVDGFSGRGIKPIEMGEYMMDLRSLEYIDRGLTPGTSPPKAYRAAAERFQKMFPGTGDWYKVAGESVTKVAAPPKGAPTVMEYLKLKADGTRVTDHYYVRKGGIDWFRHQFDVFQDQVLQYARDSGALSPELYARIKEANRVYAPMFRVLEPEAYLDVFGLSKKKMRDLAKSGGTGGITKKLKGGLGAKHNPLESILRNTAAIIQRAEQQNVVRTLVEAFASKKGQRLDPVKHAFGLGTMVEPVALAHRPTRVSVEAMKAKMKEILGDATWQLLEERGLFRPENIEADVAFWTPVFNEAKPYVVLNGKLGVEVYKLAPSLYDAVMNLNREQVPAWVAFAGAPARWLRTGATSFNPAFWARNFIRDSTTASMWSHYGHTFGIDGYRGAKTFFRKDSTYWEWMRSGGPMSTQLDMNKINLGKELGKMYRKAMHGDSATIKWWKSIVRHPSELMTTEMGIHAFSGVKGGLLKIGEMSEQMTRLGEFSKAKNRLMEDIKGDYVRRELKGDKAQFSQEAFENWLWNSGHMKDVMMEAGFASRTVSLDFAKAGARTRTMGHLVAFWNANVNSLYRGVAEVGRHRTIEGNVGPMLARYASISMLSLSAHGLLLLYGKDTVDKYMNLPLWERNMFWHIPIPDGVNEVARGAFKAAGFTGTDPAIDFGRIPKPYELGLLWGSIPQRVADWMINNGHREELVDTILKVMAPPALSWFPTAALPFAEATANKSKFFEAPIVPRGLVEKDPSEQFGPTTSSGARILANIFPGQHSQFTRITSQLPIVGDMYDIMRSPMMLDNLIGGWTGGLGKVIAEQAPTILSLGALGGDRPQKTLSDWPTRSLVSRSPPPTGAPVHRFFTHKQDVDEAYRTWRGKVSAGQHDAARAYYKKHRYLIRWRKAYERVARQLKWRRDRDRKYSHPDYNGPLTPEERRIHIRTLRLDQSKIAKRFEDMVNP